MKPRDYDSTVARIAGNILSGHSSTWNLTYDELALRAKGAVMLARAIVDETRRTEPKEPADPLKDWPAAAKAEAGAR